VTRARPPIAAALLEWHQRAGRHDLPWQQQRTAYRVWVSEVMLQQTQVATVIPYYLRFMARFPDVRALADAPLDEVLHLWSGLGYYARARNLQRAAVRVRDEHQGEFPLRFEPLAALPGIGRSTAGAILALCCGERWPILDGNARRVLARYFGVAGARTEPAAGKRLWELAERCIPQQRVSEYTQAIMDLGATVCVRRRPLCTHCPLSAGCYARRTGRQHELPAPQRARARRLRRAFMVSAGVCHRHRCHRLHPQRPAGGRGAAAARCARTRVHALRSLHHTAAGALCPQRGGHGGRYGPLV
jgi:A/G-specific adenine glycosylase